MTFEQILIVESLAILGWSLAVVLRAVWRARKLAGGAVCGECGYAITHPVPENCPECGRDLLHAGVVTIRQATRRPRVGTAIVAWALLSLIVGGVCGQMIANRERSRWDQVARVAQSKTTVITRQVDMAYQMAADPNPGRDQRAFTVGEQLAITANPEGVSQDGALGLQFVGDVGRPVKMEIELKSGTVRYDAGDGHPTTAASVEEADIAKLLNAMKYSWNPGETDLHAKAIKASIEAQRDVPVLLSKGWRLEPGYASLNLRQPRAFSTRSNLNSGPGPMPRPPWMTAVLMKYPPAAIPAALILMGWIAIPLRHRAVVRRERAMAERAQAADVTGG